MERDLLTFIIIISVIILIIVVIFRIIPLITKTQSASESLPSSQQIKEEYRRIMDKIKSDYQSFKEKIR